MDWQLPKIASGVGGYSAEHVDTELEPGCAVSVGFGNGGSQPWRFKLEEDQDIDVSFFKAFISTQPTDMRNITQASPFEQGKRNNYAPPTLPALPVTEYWATKIITVVQKAAK